MCDSFGIRELLTHCIPTQIKPAMSLKTQFTLAFPPDKLYQFLTALGYLPAFLQPMVPQSLKHPACSRFVARTSCRFRRIQISLRRPEHKMIRSLLIPCLPAFHLTKHPCVGINTIRRCSSYFLLHNIIPGTPVIIPFGKGRT